MMFATRSSLVRQCVKINCRGVHVESRLASLGITLPDPTEPKGNYVPYARSGNTVFLAGHLPQRADKSLITGRVGKDVTVEEAKEAARLIGLNLVSTMRHATGGNLDKVKRIVKLVGFVRCTDEFTQQPLVINGCSDLMVEIFGDKGKHARAAVGTNALPLGVAVEIEAIIEIEP